MINEVASVTSLGAYKQQKDREKAKARKADEMISYKIKVRDLFELSNPTWLDFALKSIRSYVLGKQQYFEPFMTTDRFSKQLPVYDNNVILLIVIFSDNFWRPVYDHSIKEKAKVIVQRFNSRISAYINDLTYELVQMTREVEFQETLRYLAYHRDLLLFAKKIFAGVEKDGF